MFSIEEILADSDSDDLCDNDQPKTTVRKPKKNKGKTLIRETEDSIIDLVDASASSKILCWCY